MLIIEYNDENIVWKLWEIEVVEIIFRRCERLGNCGYEVNECWGFDFDYVFGWDCEWVVVVKIELLIKWKLMWFVI